MGDVRVDDISTHWRTVARLRRKLIKNQVSPVHLWDVVEDFLAAC
nr:MULTISPECIES: DUF6514 family protein [Anaeromassilibacillus]